MFKPLIVATFLVAGITCSNVSLAAPTPLSCEMQMMLNGMAAMQRDQGVSRQANTLSTNRDTDLTKHETKEILDRVYIERKNSTPDEIKDAVYRTCKNGRYSAASAGNCVAMAEMASDVAKLRDAGVPSATVEARLRREVSVPEELGMAITVVRLVYKTRGTAEQLRAGVLAKCK